jgi:hypothetical protein
MNMGIKDNGVANINYCDLDGLNLPKMKKIS